jgi:hypothetical protein
LSGTINGINLGDQEMRGYLHTFASDARNYIAIGRIPDELGKRVTFLLPLVTPIHWLFAGDTNNNALNGFSLTGKLFLIMKLEKGIVLLMNHFDFLFKAAYLIVNQILRLLMKTVTW